MTKHHHAPLKTLKLVRRKIWSFEPNTLESTIYRAGWVILVGAYKTKCYAECGWVETIKVCEALEDDKDSEGELVKGQTIF